MTLCVLAGAAVAAAQVPTADVRNTNIPDMNTHFQMPSFASREAWLEKAAFLRKQILASAGLLPLPEKTPLHPQVFGRIERPGYTVEKVLLETYPGFYLGGNLYRPRDRQGPFPGIITPHGHWAYGRLENNATQVSIPARCINLARQGFVVFSYDMVGYNDTNQFPHGDEAAGPKGLGGPREDLWSINTMGLQLWNSIRAIDFLTSLPDVDASRIAATGASGGATQTFLVSAVDDRVAVAAPVNMVSAIMQGNGCEEAPNLRVDAFNVMFAAMMAPRPLLMVAATGDWTRNTPREEFPAVQSIYRLLGAEQNVESTQLNYPHNYNKDSRELVYTFFGARLLGGKGPVTEKRYRVEQLQDLLALFGRSHPDNARTMEAFTADRIAEAQRGIEQLRPRSTAELSKARADCAERLTFSLLCVKPSPGQVVSEKGETLPNGERLLLGRSGKGDRIPAVWLVPTKSSRQPPTLVVHPEGVAWVLSSAQNSAGLVRGILDRGGAVLGIDAFQTGSAKAPRDRNKRAFTVFNRTDDANRVQDILTALTYLQNRSHAPASNLVGLETGGVWTYFARALAGPSVNLAADMAQFRTDTDQEYLDRFFVPGLRKAGDFRAAAVLDSQDKLLLYNVAPEFPSEWVKESAQSAGTLARIHSMEAGASELLDWLAPASSRR
ncbi:MAG: acetylxylan esterase [Bryobacteraceae bacterium]|jgi:dienelactone hydrolase